MSSSALIRNCTFLSRTTAPVAEQRSSQRSPVSFHLRKKSTPVPGLSLTVAKGGVAGEAGALSTSKRKSPVCYSSATEGEMSDSLTMVYFPIAGRAELIRLICAAGGMTLAEVPSLEDVGKTAADFGSPGSLPVLQHGDFLLAQSGSIERYVASMSPKLTGLTAQQKAVDDFFCCVKEDLLGGLATTLFGDKDPEKFSATFDKWLGVIESKLPAEGFVNGLDCPTVADLAVLNITMGFMPFGAAMKISGYSLEKFPKIQALAELTKADPGVAKYLESTQSMAANPYGL